MKDHLFYPTAHGPVRQLSRNVRLSLRNLYAKERENHFSCETAALRILAGMRAGTGRAQLICSPS